MANLEETAKIICVVIKMSKVTLEDISAVLDVSKNTVSKALRGAPGVSEELREKIVKLATDMGYKKVLQNKKTINKITIICRQSFFADVTFWPQVFYGIGHYANKKNIKLSIENIDETKEDKSETFSSITSHPSDGYIIVGTISDVLLKRIKETNIPVVVVDHFSENIECDYINSSSKTGIYKAIKYLRQNNHKNIGFINNSISAYSFIERYEAYLKYMKEFNLTVSNDFLWLDAVYIETEYYKNKINSTKKLKNFPTAWVCVNDTTAITFINALYEMGIKVPDDVSVIGFDNISELLNPGLTTIDVPKQAMGEKALEQLIYRAENSQVPYTNIILSTQLVERNSVKKL